MLKSLLQPERPRNLLDLAIEHIAGQGLSVVRDESLPLYFISGYPELTQMQVIAVARQLGMAD